MPQRSAKESKLSQQSVSSDDAGLMAVVAQEMQTSWEKKRKEKEGRFLQLAKNELESRISATTDELASTVAEINGIYEKFVLEYASIDDDIRRIWVELLREQQRLLVLAQQKHKFMAERDKEREKGQVQGMAIAKRAMEDFNRLISSLQSEKV
ncbi:hypothetical protein SCP_1003850 [Sparassis crispa]|uniref:Uncharacterized protein n=1 Tax=Sparassis crispa TaxID=139825 RepID=A0A401GY35_9APHY|nr:hypothetical protein SCP_1003850 [Sparassis crispa]GBE87138.1 hypothetical protein SCP_1003850 [Sparassis crispa]